MGTLGVVRFEMDSEVVGEKSRLEGLGDRGVDFVYGDVEKGAA